MRLANNRFKKAIAGGRPQAGIWVSLCSNYAAEAVAGAGFDWALVDMEHSPNDVSIALGQLQAFAPYGTVPVVRPPVNDPVWVKRLLDIGAQGLLFPMVQSAAEARSAVAATRYPPRGIRGVAGTQRGNRFGRVGDYFERVEEETAVLVQVETREALERAGEIAAVDGVDGVFFGPADISADMGMIGQITHKDVWAAIFKAAGEVRAAGKPVGTLVGSAERALELFGEGFSFVACGSDAALLARGSDALIASVRAGLEN